MSLPSHVSVFVKGDSFTHDVLEPLIDVPVTQASVQQLNGRVEKLCFFCHQPGHLVAGCEALQRMLAQGGPKVLGSLRLCDWWVGLMFQVSVMHVLSHSSLKVMFPSQEKLKTNVLSQC